MNEFVVVIDRDVQLPLDVVTLDVTSEITLETNSGKYRIGWVGDALTVHSYRTKKLWHPTDKDNCILVRHRKTGEPVTYKLLKGSRIFTGVTRKKKKKGC